MTSASVGDFVVEAPPDAGKWLRLFSPDSLPVLASTATEVASLRSIEDEVDAHGLCEAIGSDPLMMLKVMSHLARVRRGREGSEPESLTAALVMLGISPFFLAFRELQTVEDRLGAVPDALGGFREVLRRSHRAARFALGFAAHRGDHDAALIHDAALLHDFAELLLWLKSPALALEVRSRQQADPHLRSSVAQRAVLNIELSELQHGLMLAWGLPALLTAITDDHALRETPQLANVRLAIRVARHSALGWDNPALPDDYVALGQLLQLSPSHVQALLLDIDTG